MGMGPAEPLRLYRPGRVSDGAGGFTMTIGVPTIIYGRVEIHDSKITIANVDVGEDIKIGDLVVVVE